MFRKISAALISFIWFLYSSPRAFAHEAYVLTNQEFNKGLSQNSTNPFAPLFSTDYLPIFLVISVLVGLSFILVILWSTTSYAEKLDKAVKRAKLLGPFTIRLAISASFFFAAQINSVLGPELSLVTVPGGELIRLLLFVIALMVFFGVFVEVAALIGMIIFIYMIQFHGFYMLTYLNYLAELIVLLMFGSKIASSDGYFFGKKLWIPYFEKLKKWETPLIRIMYGLALIYAGWSVKFIHQDLTVSVYNQYHLKDFFKLSAEFIAAGAGLSELMIGAFIVIGFAMRWTIIISLTFITLSLIYFHEMLWPHLMLYGISISLIINSSDFLTVDHYLAPWIKKNILSKIITYK